MLLHRVDGTGVQRKRHMCIGTPCKTQAHPAVHRNIRTDHPKIWPQFHKLGCAFHSVPLQPLGDTDCSARTDASNTPITCQTQQKTTNEHVPPQHGGPVRNWCTGPHGDVGGSAKSKTTYREVKELYDG